MRFATARVSYLGYSSSGATSGVAWTAFDGRGPRGGARDTTFDRNYYGAYASGADGLQVDRAAFLHNVVYGFDPHTDTKNVVVSRSRAEANGRHGFMFSEGCENNVVRDSTATGNRGVGFMVDDGTLTTGLGRPSDLNTFLRVKAVDNGWAGIVIEGGTGNSVEDSLTTGQQYGIWVRDQAAQTSVTNNRITRAATAGIRLGPGLGQTDVAGNRIAEVPVGIRSDGGSDTLISGGVISRPTNVGLRLDGDQRSARFAKVTIVAAHGHEVELGGTRTTLARVAHLVQTTSAPAGASATISMVGMLHRMVFVLWALILVPALLTRLGARRRFPAAA
jgi:hypothetical protein